LEVSLRAPRILQILRRIRVAVTIERARDPKRKPGLAIEWRGGVGKAAMGRECRRRTIATDDILSAGSRVWRSEHALQRADTDTEDSGSGVLVSLGLGEHPLDALLLHLNFRKDYCRRGFRADSKPCSRSLSLMYMDLQNASNEFLAYREQTAAL
jgi:hypothetical protein